MVERRLELASQSLGFTPEYHSPNDVQSFNESLLRKYEKFYHAAESAASGSKDAARIFQQYLHRTLNNPEKPALSGEEIRWMKNEIALVHCDARYWLTRYYFIKTPNKIQRFTFLPGQQVYFDVVAALEDRLAPIEIIMNKARQHGVSTLTEGFILHAASFTYGANCLIASADRNMTAKMSQMALLGYDMMPWWMRPAYSRRVESQNGMLVFGGLKTGISFQHGNQVSALARGDTIVKYHLSECSSYADAAALISAGLFKCVHASPSVFGVLESTAMGDSGWWYDTYMFAKSGWAKGKSRLCPLFLPWFLGTDKYPTETEKRTRPIPRGYRPSPEAREMVGRAKLYIQSSPQLRKVLGEGWEMDPEQVWFWERNYEEHKARGAVREWFTEMPTDDRESFQGSFDNVFGRDFIADVYSQRKTKYKCYGLVGQSIEEKHEPLDEEIDWTQDRIPVKYRGREKQVEKTFRWELVPLKWVEPWDLLEDVMKYEDHQGKLFVFEEPLPGYDYSVATDTSTGQNRDDTCIAVCRRGKHKSDPDVQVAEFRSNRVNHVEAYAFSIAVCAYYAKHMEATTNYREPYFSVEQVASVGDTCRLQMKNMGYSRFHKMVRYDSSKIKKQKATKEGWFTYGWSRPLLTDGFVVSVQNGWYVINSPWTAWEADHWEVHITAGGKEKKEHSSEATDDGIFANAMATFCPNDLESLSARTQKRTPDDGGGVYVEFGESDGQTFPTRAQDEGQLTQMLGIPQ